MQFPGAPVQPSTRPTIPMPGPPGAKPRAKVVINFPPASATPAAAPVPFAVFHTKPGPGPGRNDRRGDFRRRFVSATLPAPGEKPSALPVQMPGNMCVSCMVGEGRQLVGLFSRPQVDACRACTAGLGLGSKVRGSGSEVFLYFFRHIHHKSLKNALVNALT